MEQKTRKKRKLGSYPFVSVTFSITLALFVIGLFGMLAMHANKLSVLIQENIQIQVYLDKQITSAEITKITKTIEAQPYVIIKDNSPRIYLKTKEEAEKEFINQTGEDFKKFLGDNPLRDALIVNINPEFQSIESLESIKKELEKVRGVYDVNYEKNLVQSINENLTKIGMALVGFFTILLFVVVILINNTIKLALFSQRFLIRSMQLVGATSSFIRRPFLGRSVFYGLVAGVISSILLIGVMIYGNQKIEGLDQLQDSQSLTILFGGLTVLGMVVGYLSTYRAVRKYLKMSLDELY